MIIDDSLFNKHIKHLLILGLDALQNTKKYYELVQNREVADFIMQTGGATPHFCFLRSVLDNQEVTKCPACGHYEDNIECPIIRCSICDHEWKIDIPYSNDVCEVCVADITMKCKRIPQRSKSNGKKDDEI
jgi:hypothetical protein